MTKDLRSKRNQELKQAGLKVTLPRVKILSILEDADKHHLSAEDIHRILIQAGEDVGLATIYRVLTQFEEAGLVVRHHFASGHSVFELNHGESHDHLVCIRCGKVEEFVDELIEKRKKHIAKQHHFIMSDDSLTIYGTCKLCLNQVESEETC